jgi:hypothetical protein
MDFKQMLYLGWRKNKKNETEFYPLNKINNNQFKNYKTALKFLKADINKKIMYSNFEATEIDYALLTLFKSKQFMEKIKCKK